MTKHVLHNPISRNGFISGHSAEVLKPRTTSTQLLRLHLIGISITFLLSIVSGGHGATLYVSDAQADLWSVNLSTGRAQLLGTVRDADTREEVMMSDLAFDSLGTLYGINFESLYRIDLSSGSRTFIPATWIGSLGVDSANSLDVDVDGKMYAATYDIDRRRRGQLYQVNTRTGLATPKPNRIPYEPSGDLAFASDGALYMSSCEYTSGFFSSGCEGSSPDQLVELDRATGAGARIGSIGFHHVFAMDFVGNTLFGITDQGNILSIDSDTGNGTLVARTNPVVEAFGASFRDPLRLQTPFFSDSPHVVYRSRPGDHPDAIDEFAIDLADGNVEVLAAGDGTAYVFASADNSPYGNYITIDHGPDPAFPAGRNRIFTLYAHLNRADLITQGQPVKAGDILSIEGSTGRSTGTHLHFGLYSGNPAEFTGSAITHQSLEFSSDRATIEFARTPNGDPEHFTTYCSGTSPCLDQLPPGTRLWSPNERPQNLRREGTISPSTSTSDQSIRHNFSIVPFTPNLEYMVTWPVGELSLSIFQPDGNISAQVQEADGNISGRIDNPSVGVWSFQIAGVNLPSSGHPYTFSITAPRFLAGDIDLDGVVDGEDFLAWQDGFGTLMGASHTDGDADGDGDVDGDDFLIGQALFGSVATGRAAVSSVPEAESILMLILTSWLLRHLLTCRTLHGHVRASC